MSEFDLIPRQRPAATSALFILLTALGGFWLIGPAIGFFLALPFFEGNLVELISQAANPLPYPGAKIPSLIVQGSATFFGLIIIPSLYWLISEKQDVFNLVRKKSTRPVLLVLTGLLVLLFMAPNSIVIEWNANISLPEFLRGFENSARHLEELASELIRYYTSFDSVGQFIVGFFIIAILPAIGEELVFRGMLQPKVQQATGSAHLGIWISALLFSAIHMQFFGFVPRVLLGAMFGYLYLWSGNLIVPMFAHFVNNGFSVIMLYLNQLGKIDINVDSTESAPWPVVILGTVLTFGLLVFLKKIFERYRTS